MSLLMLKTKDLSWQDHTLNIEAMLAPSRCQLLVNKHKSLDARAATDKDLYDKQKVTRLKDYVIEKRMMERKRNRINSRKLNIQNERAKSANTSKPPENDDLEITSNISDSHLVRRKSEKGGVVSKTSLLPITGRLPKPNQSDIGVSNGVFVTEILQHDTKLPDVLSTSCRNVSYSTRDFDRSVSFDPYNKEHKHSKSKLFDKYGNPKPLNDRVKEFLQEQRDFNEDSKGKKAVNAWDQIDIKVKQNKNHS